VQSVVMSAVFQLAHANGESNWLTLEKTAGQVQTEWAIHQVETTVDFARGNRLLTWYTGGLNHQVEHHLFPTLSHLHLPAIAGIVQEVCKEQGVAYNEHPTLWAALLSHQRWLRSMGKPGPSPIAKAA
jgi:linoleoyl-CoA desaturase